MKTTRHLAYLKASALRLIGTLLLVGTTTFGFARLIEMEATPFVVQFQMATTLPGPGQVFAAKPASGYSESASISFPLVSDNRKHAYEAVFVGRGVPRRVRIDPGTAAGQVRLHSVHIIHGASTVEIAGASLAKAVRPLNQMSMRQGTGNDLNLEITGGDPYFEIDTPGRILDAARMHRLLAVGAVTIGIVGLLLLGWSSRREISALVEKHHWIAGLGIFLASAGATLVLMTILGLDMAGAYANGFRYGLGLLLACLCFYLVGEATLRALSIDSGSGCSRLFLPIVVGHAVLIVYFYLRSMICAAAPFLPTTPVEIFAVVLLCGAFLRTRGWRPASTPQEVRWMSFELGVLMTLCLVVAARELPRLLMLSSDPDTHAYFARQAELLGAIPWRGEGVFGYPGGSAATTFLWARLSFLDVRNALTALPLLHTFLGSLLLAEVLALRTRPILARCAIMLTALGAVTAGLLLPIYQNYSHMEGTGRQIAIVFMSLSLALLLISEPAKPTEWRRAPLLLVSLFALGVLNPVNVVIPGILLGGYCCYVLMTEKRLSPLLLVLLALPIFLLLDPYYASLLPGGASPVSKVPLIGTYETKSLSVIIDDWLTRPDPGIQFLQSLTKLFAFQPQPLFLILLFVFGVPALVLTKANHFRWPLALSALLVLAALLVVNGLFVALENDSRYFLLAPYFQFSLTQHKTLILSLVAATVIYAGSRRNFRAVWLLLLALGMIAITYASTHRTQRLALSPRSEYCGSLGCITKSDIAVLRRFERYTAADILTMDRHEDGYIPKVLVPNSVHRTDKELWVFPVAGARAAPFFDVAPVAFYYYQGDDDFTSLTYLEHVCERFDKIWLKQQGIEYLFLPANRTAACVADMERLPKDEIVIAQVENSYLLRLR